MGLRPWAERDTAPADTLAFAEAILNFAQIATFLPNAWDENLPQPTLVGDN